MGEEFKTSQFELHEILTQKIKTVNILDHALVDEICHCQLKH